PQWDPPPIANARKYPSQLLTAMEFVLNNPTASWVRERYLAKFQDFLTRRLRMLFESFWDLGSDDQSRRIARIVLRLPEGRALVRKERSQFESLLRWGDLSTQERKGLQELMGNPEREELPEPK